ncbi:MAG: CmpA/NrtA family ABC transporter substrate-binding protein [Pseudomonadota bacterium]
MAEVQCGFIPLTDAAVLIAAREMEFAAEEGIELILVREPSWSNIRDKISTGAYPAAHMLSPMAIALSLGLGPMPVTVDAPFVLNLNGNTLTVSSRFAALLPDVRQTLGAPRLLGEALREIARDQPLRIGVPFKQSLHLLLARYLLRGCGVDMARVTFTTAPPPILPEVMQAGEVDAFVVGEPWGSMAVERGDGVIALTGSAIWAGAPEKVLGVRRDWGEDNPDTLRRLIRALARAAHWCEEPGAAGVLAEIMRRPAYLNAPADVIERALTGHLICDGRGTQHRDDALLRLYRDHANYPWRSAAMWIGDQAAEGWGVRATEARRVAAETFKPDLYRRALAQTGADIPLAVEKDEGRNAEPVEIRSTRGQTRIGADRFFDGQIFAQKIRI